MKVILWSALVCTTLAGCAISHNFIQPDSRRELVFSTSVAYQEAYRRADAFGRQCHASSGHGMWNADVTGNIYTDNKTAVVHLRQESKDFERFEIEGTPSGSNVTILTATNGGWNKHEMKVARRSIQTGHITCYGDVPLRDGEEL